MMYKPMLAIVLVASSGLFAGCNVSPISSFGSAANGTAPEADPKAKSGEGIAGAILGEEKGVKPLATLEGEFDNAKALKAIYGNYSDTAKRSQWKPSKGELDKFNFYNDIKTLYSKPFFSKGFQQEGIDRYFIITRTAPDKSECEDCVPVLGGAVFTKSGEEWQLTNQSKAITRTGMNGTLSGGKLVKIGNDNYGVQFHWKSVNLGIAEEGEMLIAETKSGLKEVFSMVTAGNNKQYCEQNGLYEDDPACWSYTSKFEFVPRSSSNFFDIRITTTGTKQIAENEISPVRDTRRFSFTESGYRAVQ